MNDTLIPAATLILLADTDEGLKTLLLQRQQNTRFLPGFWVFPGGGVEPEDQQADNWQTAAMAASRETEEETGLIINAGKLLAFSRWVAPKEAPKRFDTRFFLAQSREQATQLQDSEIQASQWISPANAIAQHRQQLLPIIPPTLVSLQQLSRFSNSEQAMAFYRQHTPFCFTPKVCFWQDQTIMLYAGDVAYESLDTQQPGPRNRCLLAADGWHYQCDLANF